MQIETLRKFALSLDGVIEAPHHSFGSFRVASGPFVTLPPGDEIVHVFVGEEDRERFLTLHPDMGETLYWGAKVWGVRIHLAAVADGEATEAVLALVRRAWQTRLEKPVAARRRKGGKPS